MAKKDKRIFYLPRRPKSISSFYFLLIIVTFFTTFSLAAQLVRFYDFELEPIGAIPRGWIVEATNPRGPLATWMVEQDTTAPSGTHVFALKKVNHHSGGTFNLCWTKEVALSDIEISVKFKAISGTIDQGGGLIWRVKDRNNYYVARFNPLEDNFRLYYVKDGMRHLIKNANISLDSARWHTMQIIHKGIHIEGFLEGKRLIACDSKVFSNPGGIGLWTKADAATKFDDLSIKEI